MNAEAKRNGGGRANTPHLVVVGGGISGLAAAWSASVWAREAGRELTVTVLEGGSDFGGKACSRWHDLDDVGSGRGADTLLVEGGPNGFLSGDRILQRLIGLAGLEGSVIEANSSSRRRFIHDRGKLREVSPHPLKLARSGLLSARGLLRLAREPWQPARLEGPDESVHEFAVRRLGPEAAQKLVAPAALGIYAGSTRRLSAAAGFPLMTGFEREHGSLFAGLRAQRRQRKREGLPRPSLCSFRQGMQELPRRLADTDLFQARLNTRVDALIRRKGVFHLCCSRGAASSERDQSRVVADGVIVATETPSAAQLLSSLAAEPAELLSTIPCPGIAVVAALFDEQHTPEIPLGYGALVARGQGIRTLGCLFESHIFDHRSAPGTVLVRMLLGGQVDAAALELGDDELRAIALGDLRRITGVRASPRWTSVQRWPVAIPQPQPGHLQLRDAVEEALGAIPGVYLAGTALGGVAFSKAAETGWSEGERAARWLTTRS